MQNSTVQGNAIFLHPLLLNNGIIISLPCCPDTAVHPMLHRWAIGCTWSPSGKRLCFTGQDSSVQVVLSTIVIDCLSDHETYPCCFVHQSSDWVSLHLSS